MNGAGVVMRALSVLSVASATLWSSGAQAQTMSQVAAGQTSCTTAGGEGLSLQLVDVQRCLHPGQFVSFANADITATSARVHLVAQASARTALQTAAAIVPLAINSGFRPLSDQYLLWASGQCAVVGVPGSSNHQSGRAVDVNNTVEARTALTNAGCVWFGASDAVHYDCPGVDLRDDSVRAFQRLWNMNHPEMPLSEDGSWGPMTLAAMQASPADGFPIGGLTTCGPCTAGAELNDCGDCGSPPTEVCNGSDDDCDGMTDEGCGGPDMDAGVMDDAGMDDAGVISDSGIMSDSGMTRDGGDVRADLGAGRPTAGCSAGQGGSTHPGMGVLAGLLLGAALRRTRRVGRRGLP